MRRDCWFHSGAGVEFSPPRSVLRLQVAAANRNIETVFIRCRISRGESRVTPRLVDGQQSATSGTITAACGSTRSSSGFGSHGLPALS